MANLDNPTFEEFRRDVSDTAKFANQTSGTVTNRTGTQITPLPVVAQNVQNIVNQYDQQLNAAVLSTGWFIVGEFSAGFDFTARNQVGRDSSGELWSYNGSLPFTVSPATVPSEPDYTNRGDAALRSDLNDPNGDINQVISPLASNVRLAVQRAIASHANTQDAIYWLTPEMFAPSSHVWGVDDTEYVQAAINAASGTQTTAKYGVHLAREYTVKTCYLPNRTVEISGAGSGTGLRAHADIPASGAVLISLRGGATDGPTNQALLDGIYGAGNTPPLRTAATFLENTRLSKFNIRAASPGQDARAIWFTGFTRGCTIRDVYCQDFAGTGGVNSGGTVALNGSWTFVIDNLFVRNFDKQGVGLALGLPNNGTYIGARVCNSFGVMGGWYGSCNRGIYWREGNGAQFGGGMTSESNVINMGIFNGAGAIISGCYFEDADAQGGNIQLGGEGLSGNARNIVIMGNLLDSHNYHIQLQTCEGVRIGSNRYDGPGGLLFIPTALDAAQIVNLDVELRARNAAEVFNLSKIDNSQHILRDIAGQELTQRNIRVQGHAQVRKLNSGSSNTEPNNDAALVASTGSSATSGRASVISSSESISTAERGVVIASLRCATGTSSSVAGGTGGSPGDAASAANRRWQLESITGNIRYTGSLINSFADFGEYIENGEQSAMALGTPVTVKGGKTYIAMVGDEIDGIVSKTAGVMLNDSPFTWKQRYLTGEFGEPLYETVPDMDYELQDGESESDRPMVERQIENPDFDIKLENVPRSERPDEWTPVGMIGQMYVRVDGEVTPDDYLKSGDGIAVKSEQPTRLKLMSIKHPFDADKGYAVAYCLRT